MAERPFGLSVVIPVYNRPDALRGAIDSVVTQRPHDVEIVVVDDGSEVDPRPALPTCNASGVPIRAYRFERNRGPQPARNLGIRRARFSHIAFLDSDDLFLPQKIDTVLAALRKTPTDVLFHDVDGMPRYASLARLWHDRLRPFIPFTLWATLYNPVPTPALVIRRRVRLGPPSLRHSEDWAYLQRALTATSRVRYLPQPLARVQRAPRSAGGLSAAAWRMRRGEFTARSVLCKERGLGARLRWLAGTAVGGLRIANDLLRGRYFR